MKPKIVLNHIKATDHANLTSGRQIQNMVQKFRGKQMGKSSPLQYFFKILHEHDYFEWHREDPETLVLDQLLFMHPKSLDLLCRFSYVLLMDATCKTIKYAMPLLEIIGVTPTSQNFHVAFAFMKDEKTDTFMWVVDQLRDCFLRVGISPHVILTNRELALMKAIRFHFPEVNLMFCIRHIAKNMKKKFVEIMKKQDYTKSFRWRWERIVNFYIEEQYAEELNGLEEIWGSHSATVKYLKKELLNPYKENFVRAWTKHYLNIGNTTTNRVKSMHSALKRWLGTAIGGFDKIFPHIHSHVKLQLNEIKSKCEHDLTVRHVLIENWAIFRRFSRNVSHAALELLDIEFKRGIISDAETCGCFLSTTYGIPSAHQVQEVMRNGLSINPTVIHVFWRTLSVEGDFTVLPMPQSGYDQFHDIIKKFDGFDDQVMAVYAGMINNIIHPQGAGLNDPPVVTHKGCPKVKSTKRDLSGWEHTMKAYPKGFDQTSVSMADAVRGFDPISVSIPTDELLGYDRFSISMADEVPGFQLISFFMADEVTAYDPIAVSLADGVPGITFPFEDEVPGFIVSCVEDYLNVVRDGNCGFRVVADIVYDNQEYWTRVRQDLIEELTLHQHLYEKAIDVKKSTYIYTHFKGGCGSNHWLSMTDLGYVIATRYQKIVQCFSIKYYCNTFLPLQARLEGQLPPDEYIDFALVKSALNLRNDGPMPKIYPGWEKNCDRSIRHWNPIWKNKIKTFRKKWAAMKNILIQFVICFCLLVF